MARPAVMRASAFVKASIALFLFREFFLLSQVLESAQALAFYGAVPVLCLGGIAIFASSFWRGVYLFWITALFCTWVYTVVEGGIPIWEYAWESQLMIALDGAAIILLLTPPFNSYIRSTTADWLVGGLTILGAAGTGTLLWVLPSDFPLHFTWSVWAALIGGGYLLLRHRFFAGRPVT